jgi:hypothetical protein
VTMDWLRKAKGLWGKVKGVLTTDVTDLFKKSTAVVIDKPLDIATAKSTLEKIVREVCALSPLDIERKPRIKVTCEHKYAISKQIWVRVEAKKFELRNEMICTKCKEHKIVSIG